MATCVKPGPGRHVLVIPLIRVTPALSELTYTIPEGVEVFPGACVRIPFRTKTILGIVWGEDSGVPRNGTKNIIGRSENFRLTPEQLSLAKWLHSETLTPLNVILRSMVFADSTSVNSARREQQDVTIVECPSGSARRDVLAKWSQRIAEKSAYTLVVVPNQGAAQQWMDALEQLKPLHIVPPRTAAAQQRLRTELKDTRTYITTHVGLLYPLPPIDRVILDLADDEGYFAFDQAPRVDVRSVTHAFARSHRATLLVLTRWLSPTVAGVFPKVTPTVVGSIPAATVIDRQGDPPGERGHLPPTNLLEKLQSTRTLWLHSRTSEAGRFVCLDCGTAVLCPTCTKPLRVRSRTLLVLECVQDRLQREAPGTCAVCKGSRLSTRGAGVQQVARSIASIVGAENVATLERASVQGNVYTTTHVVATTAVRSYPGLTFAAAVMLQPDSYFSLQGYRSGEQFFSTLALARGAVASHGSLYVVTHNPANPAYQYLSNPDDWTQQALLERRALHYPPNGTLILLQPRKRIARPAAEPLQGASPPRGTTEIRFGTSWLLRTDGSLHEDLLQWVQQHLDPTWEATVNPPALPQD